MVSITEYSLAYVFAITSSAKRSICGYNSVSKRERGIKPGAKTMRRCTPTSPAADLDPREVTTSSLREFFQERKPGLDAVRGIADAKPAIS